MAYLTKQQINNKIKHLEVELVGTKGDGYFYFVDSEGNQVGDSVMVCYLHHNTLEEWKREAEKAAQCLCC